MLEYVKSFAALLVLVIIQKTLIWLIAVTSYQITPDIVLIGVVYIGIRNGKITGSASGFVSGLILDITSFSFLGLMALSKSAAGFISGYFNNENKVEKYLRTYQFVLIVFFCSLINNTIYYGLYFQGSVFTFADIFVKYIITTTIYTSLFSIIGIIIFRRQIIRR